MATIRVPKQPFDKAFARYAVNLGFALREYNTLQTNLGELFVALCFAPEKSDMAWAIWNAVSNDRTQRVMLVRAASQVLKTKDARDKQVLEDIEFISRKASILGTTRDALAHTLMIPLVTEPTFVAHVSTGHGIAQPLAGKELTSEMKIFRKRAIVLHEFVDELRDWAEYDRGRLSRRSLPDRPQWPTPTPQQEGKSHNRKRKK